MLKFLFLIIILFFAVAVAMALLTRLTQTQKKIADLHKDLQRNDDEMARHRREIERLSALQDAQNGDREIKS
jgi:cell division protein FtsL